MEEGDLHGEQGGSGLNALLQTDTHWLPVRDGDPSARRLYHRHYSSRKYRDGRRPKKIIGPGEYMLLVTSDDLAVFGWRVFRSRDLKYGHGVNCCIFRNESPLLSSMLILEADDWAWSRWPEHRRHYTYVNPDRVRSSNPGYCFKKAGWKQCGRTLGGLIVLDRTMA